jgi:hypothetical protein
MNLYITPQLFSTVLNSTSRRSIMPSIDQHLKGRGRRPEPDAKPTILSTEADTSWGAAWFHAVGIIDRIPTDIVNRMPTSFEFFIRLQRSRDDYDILQRFLDLFGGAIKATTNVSRYQWGLRGAPARTLLTSFFPYFGASMKAAVDAAFKLDVVTLTTTAVPTSAEQPVPSHISRRKTAEAPPKIHSVLPRDYDDSVFIYVEDVNPGEPYVFGLPDSETAARFAAEAVKRSYIVLSIIGTVVSLTRPPDYE